MYKSIYTMYKSTYTMYKSTYTTYKSTYTPASKYPKYRTFLVSAQIILAPPPLTLPHTPEWKGNFQSSLLPPQS